MMAAALILIIAAVVGSVAVTAVVAWLIQRTNRVEGGDARDGHRLAAEAEDLREQILSLEEEMAKLRERVDFTEKLLEGPRERPAPDTPPAEGGPGRGTSPG